MRFLKWCTHLKVISKDEGMMSFSPNTWYDGQLYVVHEIFTAPESVRTFILLKARQLGISTLCCALDLYWSFRFPKLQGALVSADYEISAGMRDNLRTFYSNLPMGARMMKKRDNALMMSFNNGSRIRFLFTTAKKSKKGNMGRSGTANFGHFTEVAFFQNVDDLNSFMATLSDTHPNRLYIFESTANGFGLFSDMWDDAEDSLTKKRIFLGWWLKETYRLTPGPDLDKYSYPMSEPEKEMWQRVKKDYGYEVSMSQLAWWRKMCKEEMKDHGALSREDMMNQEYPWHHMEAFRSSGSHFFKWKNIDNMKEKSFDPIRRLEPVFRKEMAQMELVDSYSGRIKLWEDFEPEAPLYILGADPTWAVNPRSDYGIITIYKCFKDRIEQVLEYSDKGIQIMPFTWLFLTLAGMWQAPQIYEITGPGMAMRDHIEMYRRWIRTNRVDENMTIYDYAKKLKAEYLYSRPDSLSPAKTAFQWKTSGEQKERLLYGFQTAVNNDDVVIRSGELIQELGHFIKRDTGELEAEKGHDDRVIASALVWHYWMINFRSRLMTRDEYLTNREKIAEEKRKRKENPIGTFMNHHLSKAIIQATRGSHV